MRVRLDGEDVRNPGATLATAIDAARLKAEERGRVVVEVRLDGRALTEEELARVDRSERMGSVVEFVSAEPRSLVRVTLLELIPMLEGALAQQDHASDEIGAGRMQEGLQALASALEIWNGVQRAVGDGVRLLGMEVGDVTLAHADSGADPEPLADRVERLAACLTEIKRSLQAQDVSALCDVLSYDLKEEGERWQGVLQSLADLATQTVRGSGAPDAQSPNPEPGVTER